MKVVKTAETLNPEAKWMILPYRSFGYTLSTAIADIIDNSITAGASIVKLDRMYQGEDSVITILDNGSGMTEYELIESMKLGALLDVTRSAKDLGRFGHGMKTASFSQCKSLTVISKKNGHISTRTWDLDHVSKNGWELLEIENPPCCHLLEEYEHGTLLVWQKMDRLTSGFRQDSNEDLCRFGAMLEPVNKHLSLVFHKFIENNNLCIYGFGDIDPIEPFDPLLESYNEATTLRDQNIGNFRVVSCVMPPKSDFNRQQLDSASQGKGWVKMQGFYIYRANRLLTAGGWLGLKHNGINLKTEAEYDLARIAIYLDNNPGTDVDWSIDIKKSHASIPSTFKDILAAIAYECRQEASKTRRSRSIKLERNKAECNFEPIWKGLVKRGGKHICKLNWENTLICSLLDEMPNARLQKKVKTVLRIIEEFLPIEEIAFEETKEDNNIGLNYAVENCSQEEIEVIFNELVELYVKRGFGREDAIELTKKIIKK